MLGTSIAIMDKGASGYADASSSEERERQSDSEIRKLRAELEQAEQARKDELAKKAKDKEEEVKEASNSTEESGYHLEEESDEGITGESSISSSRKSGKVAAQKWAFDQKVEKEAEKRTHGMTGWHLTIDTVNSQAHAQSARGTERRAYTPRGRPRAQ